MLFRAPITGRCMEGVGIYEEDIVMIDTETFPRPEDVCWCVIDGQNMVKKYKGEAAGIHFVGTAYIDRMQMGYMLRREEIGGTVIEVQTPEGKTKWTRPKKAPEPLEIRWGNARPV